MPPQQDILRESRHGSNKLPRSATNKNLPSLPGVVSSQSQQVHSEYDDYVSPTKTEPDDLDWEWHMQPRSPTTTRTALTPRPRDHQLGKPVFPLQNPLAQQQPAIKPTPIKLTHSEFRSGVGDPEKQQGATSNRDARRSSRGGGGSHHPRERRSRRKKSKKSSEVLSPIIEASQEAPGDQDFDPDEYSGSSGEEHEGVSTSAITRRPHIINLTHRGVGADPTWYKSGQATKAFT